jgi:hypothetical protein
MELHYDDLRRLRVGRRKPRDSAKGVLPPYKHLANPNKVFTKQQIMDEIWGMDTESDPHTLDRAHQPPRERSGKHAVRDRHYPGPVLRRSSAMHKQRRFRNNAKVSYILAAIIADIVTVSMVLTYASSICCAAACRLAR